MYSVSFVHNGDINIILANIMYMCTVMFIYQYTCEVTRILNCLQKGQSHFDNVHVCDLSDHLFTQCSREYKGAGLTGVNMFMYT
jgi:hypothetical protein